MTKIIELKQDRNLIRSNFDGYKLSLESIPILRQELDSGPVSAKLLENQYSFLHAELFSLQNLLQQDQWNRNASYFIAQNGYILKCLFNVETGRPSAPQPVFKISSHLMMRTTGDYNFTFQFVSEEYCIVCDGIDNCLLMATGDRSKSTEWKKSFEFKISEEYKNFILKDSRLDVIDDNSIISCLFQRIEFNGKKHFTQLFWSTLTKDGQKNNWSFRVKDILAGRGSILYGAFEPKAGSLIVGSNRKFNFNTIANTDTIEHRPSILFEESAEYSNTEQYNWSQTNEDITITFQKANNKNTSDFSVKSTSNRITVNDADNILLDSELFAKVDAELTIWTWEKDLLKITLVKAISNTNWPCLVEGGPSENIVYDDEPVSNLEAPVEDCDYPLNSADDDFFIERFNLMSKEVTHRILLGNSPPLFSTISRPGFPPAIVTRTDVDASLWLQQFNPIQPEEWSFRHEGNLHAFGYVQASKQQKKFINCAPDMSYSVICESYRHVFIYKSENESANGLRNRGGPQIKIGKQSLVTLEDAGEVLGMQCDTNFITLLTEKCILFLQINNF